MGFKGYKRKIQLDFDYESVKQGIPNVNKQMALLDSEFRKVSTQTALYGSVMDKTATRHEYLSKKVELQKSKVEELKKSLETAKNSTGNNSKAVAEYSIKLKNAEKELIKMQAEQKKINQELQQQQTKLGQASVAWQDFKESAENAGINIDEVASKMQKIGAGMVGLGVVSAKAFLDFDSEFQKVLTIADETEMSFDDLRAGALNTARTYNVAAGQTANALYQIQSSGISTGKSLDVLNDTAKLAKTGLTDMSTAGDILTTIINTYGLSTEDAAHITDQLIVTQKVAKTTVGEMGSEFGKVAGLAGTSKIPFEELGAALAVMTQKGLGTDEALTSIRGILTSVISPTKEATTAAEQYGIDLSLTSLQAKGFAGFLEDIVKKTHGNQEAMTELFGNVRALNGILMLTSQDGMAKYKGNLNEIQNSSGAADEALKRISETASGKFSKAMNDLKVAAIEAGAKFAPIIVVLSGFLTLLSKVPKETVLVISAIGGLLVTVGTIIKLLDSIFGPAGMIMKAGKIQSNFNSLLENKTFFTFAKWAAVIIAVALALSVLVAMINYLLGRGDAMNRGAEKMANSIGSAKSAISGGMRRGYAVGSNYTSVGFARMHEYGDEIRETAKGDKIYTAEQSRQMIANMKRDDDRIAGLLQQLIDKVEKLEDRVRVLPDRQLQLERGG